jgi:hypothetical protein
MKKKASRVCRARFNAGACGQVNGEHHKDDNEAALVVNNATFHTLLTLTLKAVWRTEALDVKGGSFMDCLQMASRSARAFQKDLKNAVAPTWCDVVEGNLWTEAGSACLVVEAIADGG